ncbi:MAG: BlaI/MecI/CopY family transcriptional regulator [Armatimonadetes bacterium]|nr:BlaI/MecI/CopY family transcriptional regulator [Armatimonadota bacterium]
MSERGTKRCRPNIVGIEKGIGPLEAQVVRTISQLTVPVSVREVCDEMARDGYFAYQGVLNCMNRLARKGILEREKQGTAFLYRPLVNLEDLAAEVVSNVLGHMGGQRDRVICRVLDIDPDVGAEEIAELRRKVQDMARAKRDRQGGSDE